MTCHNWVELLGAKFGGVGELSGSIIVDRDVWFLVSLIF